MVGVLLRHAFAQALALCLLSHSAVPALGARMLDEVPALGARLLDDEESEFLTQGGSDAVDASAPAALEAEGGRLARAGPVPSAPERLEPSGAAGHGRSAADRQVQRHGHRQHGMEPPRSLAQGWQNHDRGDIGWATEVETALRQIKGYREAVELESACFLDDADYSVGCKLRCPCQWFQQCYPRHVDLPNKPEQFDVGVCSISVLLTCLSSLSIVLGALAVTVSLRIWLSWNDQQPMIRVVRIRKGSGGLDAGRAPLTLSVGRCFGSGGVPSPMAQAVVPRASFPVLGEQGPPKEGGAPEPGRFEEGSSSRESSASEQAREAPPADTG